jgi:hypothetical protein
MLRVAPAHDRSVVDAAGDVIAGHALPSEGGTDAALEIVNNWRASHSFPLNAFKLTLRRNAYAVSAATQPPLVAQRIKRLPAITDKLKRLLRLKLSAIQDIGGCRAVLHDIKGVYDLRGFYGKSSIRHRLDNENDYLAKPKDSGYRGIHLIYEYKSDRSDLHNGLKIEVQLRTRLQHAWATAVETVGLFSNQSLKAGRGDAKWLRFFALMGSVIARRENAVIVPGTPATAEELISELKQLASDIGAREKLNAYGQMLQLSEPTRTTFSDFLLELKPSTQVLTVTGFDPRDRLKAREAYLAAERSNMGNPDIDIVLVTVDTIKSLRTAYPNYYQDTHQFVEILNSAIR